MIKLYLFKLMCLAAAGVSDRIRGGWQGPGGLLRVPRKLPVLFEGLVFFLLVLAVLPMALWAWAIPAGILGGLLAWRQDNGFRGQFVWSSPDYDPTDLHRWYGPIRFGALQGFILLPLAVIIPEFAYFIYAAMVGQVLALFISERLFKTHIEEGRVFNITNAWPGSELLGPILTGVAWAAILMVVELFS